MTGNNGGPWGGGSRGGGSRGGGNGDGTGGGGDDDVGGGFRPPRSGPRTGPRRAGEGQIPEIDELMKKGQEQLRVLMGGRGRRMPSGPGGGGEGPRITRGMIALLALGLFVLWFFASFYTVQPEEQGVELFLGDYYRTTDDGPHLAPWPFVRVEVLGVTRERSEDIGTGRSGSSGGDGLMLTTDENIVDIDFQVVWNIADPAKYLFNLRDGEQTIRAVSESAMREIVAGSELAPILNRDRGSIADRATQLIQSTLDGYDSGISIIRVNLAKADPPAEVIDAFRDVQAAEQERDQSERQADAYANRVLAGARGEAAQVLEEAEGYRARVINEAQGEASRFLAVLGEYEQAPEVTRKRLYLETMERVLGGVDKIILDENVGGGGSGGGQGVVPYLPLNELRRSGQATQGGN